MENITRIETYLAKIAGESVEVPEPITRVEQYLNAWAKGAKPSYKGYWVEFSAPEEFTISAVKEWNGKIEYSYDGEEWTRWNGTEIAGTKIYLRGTSNRTISDTNPWTLTGDDISCSGNIENLLDYKKVASGEHPVMETWCFSSMFAGCTGLIAAPRLPAPSLTHACYKDMFYGCTSLQHAPELPATELAEHCYEQMFTECTSLETAPDLPAATLAYACYYAMFYGCTSLKTAPALPATSLAAECYAYMFRECTSLETPPELPATNLAINCYESMFVKCTSLETAPDLPATQMTYGCYQYMFSECTSLTLPPKLQSTALAHSCYRGMFAGCTSLEAIPYLPATIAYEYCYSEMFRNSNILLYTVGTHLYEFFLPITTTATGWNYDMFNGSPQAETRYSVDYPTIYKEVTQ